MADHVAPLLISPLLYARVADTHSETATFQKIRYPCRLTGAGNKTAAREYLECFGLHFLTAANIATTAVELSWQEGAYCFNISLILWQWGKGVVGVKIPANVASAMAALIPGLKSLVVAARKAGDECSFTTGAMEFVTHWPSTPFTLGRGKRWERAPPVSRERTTRRFSIARYVRTVKWENLNTRLGAR